jgi:nucleotide-binding universal stress UspA family protein
MTSETGQQGPAPVVVVGVDGSPESVAALQWAARYSEATGATVRAVLSWHFPAAAGPAPVGVAPKPISNEINASMQETLGNAIAEVYGEPSPGRVESRIDYGHPAQVLIDESGNADLLVVGSRGHGKFTGMVIGSVSIHCVTHAHCPVVVVRTS